MQTPRLRFRLRTLLLLTLIVCCWLAYTMSVGRRQRLAVSYARDQGGVVIYEKQRYEYAWDQEGAAEPYQPGANQPFPPWLQRIVDPNHYNRVVAIRFGNVLVEDVEDVQRYGFGKFFASRERNFERDGPIIMSYNNVTDQVFEQLLEKMEDLPGLQYLGLEKSKITDKHLQDLADFPQLREIKLRGCRLLTDSAIEQLRGKMPQCKISN